MDICVPCSVPAESAFPIPAKREARYMYTAAYDEEATFAEDVNAVTGAEVHRRTVSEEDIGFGLLTSFSQGLTDLIFQLPGAASQRIGISINMLSIDGHILVKGSGADTTYNQVRIGICQYNQDQQPSPSFNPVELLENNDFPMGPYRLEEKGKFTIVWDAYVTLSNNSASPRYLQTFPVSIDVSQNPLPSYFGTVAKKYHYFIFALSNHTGDSNPILTYSLNMLYTDS